MKYRLEIIVATRSISIAKKYRPVGHKLYETFHHYLALAHNKGIKY